MSEFSLDFIVPTRNDIGSCSRVVAELRQQQRDENMKLRILISVSDPTEQANFERHFGEVDGVEVLPSTGDLSLYGNFRRLVHSSRAEWLSICADDDSKAPDFAWSVRETILSGSVLAVPEIQSRKYARPQCDFDGEAERIGGKRISTLGDLLLPCSSWIFGAWRVDWIQHNFPSEDFDWLDVALVQNAVSKGRQVFMPVGRGVLTVGFTPHRLAWSVGANGKHSTVGWKTYCRANVQLDVLWRRFVWRLVVEPKFQLLASKLNYQARASRTGKMLKSR